MLLAYRLNPSYVVVVSTIFAVRSEPRNLRGLHEVQVLFSCSSLAWPLELGGAHEYMWGTGRGLFFLSLACSRVLLGPAFCSVAYDTGLR